MRHADEDSRRPPSQPSEPGSLDVEIDIRRPDLLTFSDISPRTSRRQVRHGGQAPKEFGVVNALDCRTEGAPIVGELELACSEGHATLLVKQFSHLKATSWGRP